VSYTALDNIPVFNLRGENNKNKIFKTDAKKFYREIGKSKIEVKEPPRTDRGILE